METTGVLAELSFRGEASFPKLGRQRRELSRLCFKFFRLTAAAAVWFIAVMFFQQQADALDPNKHVTQYIHTSWRTQDGSLPAGMFSIAQTSDGFLWALSLPGDIYRFDGVRFLPLHANSGPVGKILADQAGGLWVVGNELVHLKNGVVTSHYELKGIHGFQSLSEGVDGSLWVGRRGPDSPLCNVTDQGIKCFGKDEGIPLTGINAVLPDGQGGLWLGGENALVHWHEGGSQNYPVKGLVTSLALASDRTLWVGNSEEGPESGLAQLKQGVVKPFVTSTFDGRSVQVTSMLSDRDGNLWVATDAKGVFRIHGNNVEHYGRTDGLSGDSVWALFEDREGIIWAGSTNGIDSFRDPRLTTFSAVEGLGKDLAAGILVTTDGTVWVANAGSLDRITNGSVSSIRRSNGLPGDQVTSLLQDHAGNMWVGVDDGLYLFKDGRFRRIPEPDHQPLGMVVGLTEDVDGNVWAECASKPRKLVRIRDFQIREIFPGSQVPAGHNLAPDPNGGIWVDTLKGDLVRFRNGIVETTIPLQRTGSPLNRQIVAQADGALLVGTDNGLVGYRKGKVQRMTTKNGLPCDFVITFIPDNDKRWWLYTRCGVVELQDSELQRWWANPDAVVQSRLYDLLDGAQPNIGSFNQAAVSPDGRIWFASGVVVQVVDPSRLSRKALPALTHIESVTVDRKNFAATADLKFAAHPRDLEINYTSPMLAAPQKVKFRYRLDGYDKDWHDAGTRRQAFYTDLPPGKYTFRVIAANSDGVWNESAAKLDFTVVPAYYQANWFRTLCAMLFMALLWAAYQWRVRHLHHEFEMTLEARVGERTRIARELHDTLLQSAYGVLLRFQTVSQMLPGRPAEAKQKLDSAIDKTAQFITEARDEVQGLRDSTTEGNNLALAISTLGQELAGASSNQPCPEFQVTVEGTAQDLRPIIRDEIYKVAAEALRNVFRHAKAGRVEVEIRYGKDEFRLRVRDDGKGIDPAILARHGREGHYGLHGMRERAAVIGGKLTVWSEIDTGTEVELRVPVSAYATGRKRFSLLRKVAATA